MKKVFFTADTHFGHFNIIKYCKRPFVTAWDMDEHIITQWNAVVGENDEVYHLGDFALYGKGAGYALRTFQRLNGKIYLIRGNHDKRMFKGTFREQLEQSFIWIKDYHELTVQDHEMGGKQLIVMTHYPFLTWNRMHHGSWHLHGHCHGTLPDVDTNARLDVGVDKHGFTPVSYDRLKLIMTRKVFKPVDHHGKKKRDEDDI